MIILNDNLHRSDILNDLITEDVFVPKNDLLNSNFKICNKAIATNRHTDKGRILLLTPGPVQFRFACFQIVTILKN